MEGCEGRGEMVGGDRAYTGPYALDITSSTLKFEGALQVVRFACRAAGAELNARQTVSIRTHSTAITTHDS